MSNPLLANITQVIAANLPAQVGEALQERLKQADKDAKDLDAAVKRIADVEGRLAAANARMRTQEEYDKAVAQLHVDQETLCVDRMTLDHKLEIADLKTRCAYEGKKDVIDLVGQIFRTPGFKRVLTTSENESVPMTLPGQSYVSQQNRSRTVTSSEEVASESGPTKL